MGEGLRRSACLAPKAPSLSPLHLAPLGKTGLETLSSPALSPPTPVTPVTWLNGLELACFSEESFSENVVLFFAVLHVILSDLWKWEDSEVRYSCVSTRT